MMIQYTVIYMYVREILIKLDSVDSVNIYTGARWLSVKVLDSGSRGCGIEPLRRCCVVSLNKALCPLLSTDYPMRSRLDMTENCSQGRGKF